MTQWSDDALSAYLDGELPASDAEALASDLREDVALQARLDALRAADDAARAAFEAPLSADGAERLLRLVQNAEEPAAQASGDNVVSFRPRPAASTAWQGFDWRMAAAACLLLGVGWAGGAAFQPAGPSGEALLRADATTVEPGNPLFALLQSTPSAEVVVIDGENTFKPILTFASADGRPCREFELAAGQASSVAVACRETDRWVLEILLAADDRPSASASYVPASGFNAAALDAALQALGAGAPLSKEDEAALIAGGWKQP